MESRDDSTNAERILRNIVPVSQLVSQSASDISAFVFVFFRMVRLFFMNHLA
jgi:hypothetical protein